MSSNAQTVQLAGSGNCDGDNKTALAAFAFYSLLLSPLSLDIIFAQTPLGSSPFSSPPPFSLFFLCASRTINPIML